MESDAVMDTTDQMALSWTESSMFFRLPREIRDTIYCHTLVADGLVIWPADKFTKKLTPNLLLTCRTVYEEAAPILYQQNTFGFEHPSDCNMFRYLMDADYARSITSFVFRIPEENKKLWRAYLDSTDKIRSLKFDFPNLKRIRIFMKRQQWWPPTAEPGEIFDKWQESQTLKDLCASLEDKTRAEVSIFCSIRIPAPHFEYVRREKLGALRVAEETRIQTKPLEKCGCFIYLQLLPHSAWDGFDGAGYSTLLDLT